MENFNRYKKLILTKVVITNFWATNKGCIIQDFKFRQLRGYKPFVLSREANCDILSAIDKNKLLYNKVKS